MSASKEIHWDMACELWRCWMCKSKRGCCQVDISCMEGESGGSKRPVYTVQCSSETLHCQSIILLRLDTLYNNRKGVTRYKPLPYASILLRSQPAVSWVVGCKTICRDQWMKKTWICTTILSHLKGVKGRGVSRPAPLELLEIPCFAEGHFSRVNKIAS